MLRTLTLLTILCTVSLHAQAPGTIEVRRGGKVIASNRDTSKPDLRVLFIGNSLTYWNEMPWMFERFAESLGHKPRTRFSGRSGMSLRQHWEQGQARKAIGEGPWDFVVLQPKSSEMMRVPEETAKYARLFDEVIKRSGAKTVLLLTWAPVGAPYSQKDLTPRYLELARALRARVAPIGVAWAELQRAGLEMEEGAAHPNLLGSYLSVCVFYATLYGKNPAGATHKFDVAFDIDEFYRRGLQHDTIPAHVAETIQRKAWEVSRR